MAQRYSTPLAQALGDTLTNFGNALASGPTQAEIDQRNAEMEYYRARSDEARSVAEKNRWGMGAESRLAEGMRSILQPVEGPRASPTDVGPQMPVTKADYGQLPNVLPALIGMGGNPEQGMAAIMQALLQSNINDPNLLARQSLTGADMGKTLHGIEMANATKQRADDLTHDAAIYGHNKDYQGKIDVANIGQAGDDRRQQRQLAFDDAHPSLTQAQAQTWTAGNMDVNTVPTPGSVGARLAGGSNPSAPNIENYVVPNSPYAPERSADGRTNIDTGQPLRVGSVRANMWDLQPTAGVSTTLNPDGTVTTTVGGPAKMTEAQSTAASRGQLMRTGIDTMKQVDFDKLNPAKIALYESLGSEGFSGLIAGSLVGDDQNASRYLAGRAAILEGVAAAITGAAFSGAQEARYKEAFTPKTTDIATIRADKINRAIVFLSQMDRASNGNIENLDDATIKRLADEALQGSIFTEDSGGAAPPAAAGASGPAPGAVEGGYRFKGGDPSDQNNWELVQ